MTEQEFRNLDYDMNKLRSFIRNPYAKYVDITVYEHICEDLLDYYDKKIRDILQNHLQSTENEV